MNWQRCTQLTIAAAALIAASRLTAQAEFEGPDHLRRRQAWYEDARAYPNREVDWESIARSQWRAWQQTGPSFGMHLASLSGGSWTSMGPYGFFGAGYWNSPGQTDAGRIDGVALHPTDPGTVLVATPYGGVWRTIDGGASWAPTSDNQCTLKMAGVQFDPVNPNIAYAVGSSGSTSTGCGFMRSTDGGATWTNLSVTTAFVSSGGTSLYIDRATAGSTSSTVLMLGAGFNSSTSSGILRSTNSGLSWSRPLTFGIVTSIVALPASPGVLFAGVSDYATNPSSRSGLYRSSDNGVSWSQVSSGSVDFGPSSRIQLATSAARPRSVWVLMGDRNRAFGSISRWDDSTSTMTALASSQITGATGRVYFGAQAEYDLALAVDPSDASRIYLAGVRAFRSTDGGVSWSSMATEIHCDWHYIAVDPRVPRQVWAGTDGGVYVSTDGGDTWVSRNYGLSISMYYPGIAQHPTDPSIVLGGLQDNGVVLGNATAVYNGLITGDGGFAAINYRDATISWFETQWSSAGANVIRRTVLSGVFSSQPRTTGIAATDRASFIPPYVMDPVTPTTLYFGTMKLYRTVDDGLNWTALSTDLSKGSGYINAIAIAPADVLTIYVGTSDGNVQVSRNGGTAFTLASGLPNRAVTDVAVDPSTATRALVTLSGTAVSHVWLTADAGVTWTNVSGNLPDLPTNAAVIIDGEPTHFFVGTDAGVYESTDGGLTWAKSPSGMPNVVVNDLSYNKTTKQLVAATFGRGLWKYSLANAAAVLRGDVNRDGTVNAADALLIQQSLVGTALASGLTVLPHGDGNCNGALEAADALITLRYAVGLTTSGACVGTVR